MSLGGRLRDSHIPHCGRLEETPGCCFLCQQQFDLPSQVTVFAACTVEKCLPRFRPTLQSCVEEFLYSPPMLLVHDNAVLAVSQCYALQCVAGEEHGFQILGLRKA